MSTTTLYAELIVVGSGAAIFVVLLVYSLFGDPTWFAKLPQLSSIGNVVALVPVISVVYFLGIVMSSVGYVLFEGLEKTLREHAFRNKALPNKAHSDKALSDKTHSDEAHLDKAHSDKAHSDKALSDKGLSDNESTYSEIRNTLYTSTAKDLIEAFAFRRSKIRICRGWFVNCILIIVALVAASWTEKIQHATASLWIINVALLMVGTRVSWWAATDNELEWLKSYANGEVRKPNLKK